MNNLRSGYFTANTKPEFHQIALQFASEQDTVTKGKKVYLNTLAVLAVREFLEESSFETALKLGDSWNSVVRCFHDVADLVIPDIGKLECLPITEDKEQISIPNQAINNRIACVVVLLSEQLDRAQFLGFVSLSNLSSSISEISLTELQPIENLIGYLLDLELANDYLLSDDEVATTVRERLEFNSISDIASQFERIIRTVDPNEQQNRGVDVLAELMGIEVEPELVLRSPDSKINTNNTKRQELENLAETLLSRFKDIWAIEPSNREEDTFSTSVLQKWHQLREQKDNVVSMLSQYLGDKETKIIKLLQESIYLEDIDDRNESAVDYLRKNKVGSVLKSGEEAESDSISMTPSELLGLVEQLWDKLGI